MIGWMTRGMRVGQMTRGRSERGGIDEEMDG